jgi:hypothetical protein
VQKDHSSFLNEAVLIAQMTDQDRSIPENLTIRLGQALDSFARYSDQTIPLEVSRAATNWGLLVNARLDGAVELRIEGCFDLDRHAGLVLERVAEKIAEATSGMVIVHVPDVASLGQAGAEALCRACSIWDREGLWTNLYASDVPALSACVWPVEDGATVPGSVVLYATHTIASDTPQAIPIDV